MNGEYKVYVHINKVNRKIYIGQTKQTLEQRSSNGNAYKNCRHFWNAIQKYGWENFEHIVLIENLSLEMANIIEEYLIRKYNSTNDKIGYNLWFGGNNREVNEETRRIQREKKIGYNPWKIWDKETIENIKRKNSISKMGEKNPMYGKQISEKAKRLRKERRLHVLQYDLDGKFVKEWNSLEDASIEYNIAKANISKSCNEPTSICRGFLWRYKQGKVISKNIKSYKEMMLELDSVRSAQFKPVYQYDLNGYYITNYEDFHEAEEVTGIKSYGINICCRGDLISCGGFFWSHTNDENKIKSDINRVRIYKKVYQYDKDNNYIREFENSDIAEKETGISKNSIQRVCQGKYVTAGGYKWSYLKEEKLNQILKDNVKGYNSWSSWKNKKVYQLDKNKNIIRLFDSIASAEKETGINHSSISKCCKGKMKSAGGFLWKYESDCKN